MKVLIVNKFLYPNGGSETYIFGLGDALVKRGCEVQYFGMEHKGRIVGNSVNAYTSDMDFHGGSRLSKLTYPIKTIYSTEARRKLRLVLDDFKPDVVHLNNFNYQLTPSIILEIISWKKATGRKCKIVFTAHDYQLLCPNHMFNNPKTHKNCTKCLGGKFGNCIKGRCIHESLPKSAVGAMEGYFWKLKGVYKYIDLIICCSAFMKDQMDKSPIFADKTIARHNFIEHADFEGQCSKSSASKDRPSDDNKYSLPYGRYILYFGRFSKEKGVRTLIAAAKLLPDVNFVFAGKGEYSDEIDALPNAKNVGFKSGKELDSLISGAIASVCPSEWYENCPFSVMESQERLTPVIGARIGGIPELVEDGKTGWLFESGNVSELASVIKKVWESYDSELAAIKDGLKSLHRLDALEYADWFVDVITS